MVLKQAQQDYLEKNVISGGYCIGCGACTATADSKFEVELDSFGRYQAKRNGEASSDSDLSDVVCPFHSSEFDEDTISASLYQYAGASYDKKIGWHLATYAGYVNEGNFRERGSSGGMATWISLELLRSGEVDGVAHVIPTHEQSPLFKYRIARSEQEILEGAKSRYYPVEMSQILGEIQKTPGRYAIVGIPCFIKAIRLLSKADPVINERIRFTISLFCGHLKSTRFSQLFAWQAGIDPTQIESIDFRKKLPAAPASHYGVEVTSRRNTVKKTKPITELFGSNWGYGFLKYNACDYCDDVVGETADIAVGDAWLPEFVNDSKGTNVVIVRNLLIHNLIKSAILNNRLKLTPLTSQEVLKSQEGGFRHRREGLAYRLFLKEQEGKWHPKKRVEADSTHLTDKEKKKFSLRLQLASTSHLLFQEALEKGSLSYFIESIQPTLKEYTDLYRPSMLARTTSKLRKAAQLLIKVIRRS